MQTAQRVRFLCCALIFVLGQLLAFGAVAQTYPSKPVLLLLGNAPGGATDSLARFIAPRLSQLLGQPVIIENRPGAGTAIATAAVAKAPPDGHTLFLASGTAWTLPVVRANLPFDLERDFAPVSLVATGALVLVVHPSLPVRSVKDLVALARSRPGEINYGTSGVGSLQHFAGELFNLLGKVKTVHVPYKGSSQFAIATAAGEIEMSFPSDAAALPLLHTGRVRALAVTGTNRSSLLPSLPTLAESGLPGYVSEVYQGVLAPAAVPRNIIAQLNAAINKVVNTPEMKEAINKVGLHAQTSTPEQFAAWIRRELAQNAKLAKAAGIEPQ